MQTITVIEIPVIEEEETSLTYAQWLKMTIEEDKCRLAEAEEGIAWWTAQLEQAATLHDTQWAGRGLAMATKNREAWLRHIADFETDLAAEQNK